MEKLKPLIRNLKDLKLYGFETFLLFYGPYASKFVL